MFVSANQESDVLKQVENHLLATLGVVSAKNSRVHKNEL
jgi:hypothetical protein